MKEKLNNIADELRQNVNDRFDLALLTIVESFADLEDCETVCSSCGNLGLNLTRDTIELVDIEASKALVTITIKVH